MLYENFADEEKVIELIKEALETVNNKEILEEIIEISEHYYKAEWYFIVMYITYDLLGDFYNMIKNKETSKYYKKIAILYKMYFDKYEYDKFMEKINKYEMTE